MTLRRRPCCKHEQVKHTRNRLPFRQVGAAARGGRGRVASLTWGSAGCWFGRLGWIPRSGLPSHIHMQNVCGTVNHFFKYRTGGGAATAGRKKARLRGSRPGTSSRVTPRSSGSRWVLDKSFGVNRGPEGQESSTDPRQKQGLLPRGGEVSRGRSRQRKGERTPVRTMQARACPTESGFRRQREREREGGLTLHPVAPPCRRVVSGSLEDGFDTEG